MTCRPAKNFRGSWSNEVSERVLIAVQRHLATEPQSSTSGLPGHTTASSSRSPISQIAAVDHFREQCM